VRLFVALRPPPDAVEHLRALRPRWPSPPDRWHVTLAFLGDVGSPAAIDHQLRERVAGATGFGLRLEGSGTFGRNGPVWVGVGGDVDALRDLAGQVSGAAGAAGIALESRTFRPHLTVGKRGHPIPTSLTGYRGPAWRAAEVELVRSDLGRTVVHTVLERYPLR
jgi:2'-5' RNA ligase